MCSTSGSGGYCAGQPTPDQSVLFIPDVNWMAKTGLQLEDAMVAPDKRGQIQLLLSNPGDEAIKVEGESELGTLEELSLEQHATEAEDVVVSLVKAQEELSDLRAAEVSKAVDVCPGRSPHETTLFQTCVQHAADVFALTSKELGEVEEVQHSIDTGTSPPIRQAPRRTPFALRPKIAQMVSDMLASDVIQESKSPWSMVPALINAQN